MTDITYPDIQADLNSGKLTPDEAVGVQTARDKLNSHGNYFTFKGDGSVDTYYSPQGDANTGLNFFGSDGKQTGFASDLTQTFGSLAENVSQSLRDAANKAGDLGGGVKTALIALAVISVMFVTYKLVK